MFINTHKHPTRIITTTSVIDKHPIYIQLYLYMVININNKSKLADVISYHAALIIRRRSYKDDYYGFL